MRSVPPSAWAALSERFVEPVTGRCVAMNVTGRTSRKYKLNLREGPSTRRRVEKVLRQGSKVQLLEWSADGKWARVYAVEVGVEGWVYDRYVTWETAPVAGPAVMPLLSVNKVHSWPTYNLDLKGKYDRGTGLLISAKWRIKGRDVKPADVWAGREKTYPFGAVGTGEYHGAVDIVPEPPGSNPLVLAAFPGKAVLKRPIGNHDGIIFTWTELDGTSFLTIYRHLAAEIRVRVGQTINAGEEIGRLGDWGGNEHLHAEVISPAPLPGVAKKWGVPCKSAETANSQFKDALFGKWVKLPYYMYNLVAVVDWFNRRAGRG
jgi:murein DD-endopeptidase MepM/ murein hydrolase activator NlpD